MKKISYLVLALATITFWGCSQSDKSQEAPQGARDVSIGESFIIGNIEITISNLRIGKVEFRGSSGRWVTDSKPFLLADVNLKNTNTGKIVTILDTWKDATLKDEHGNIYYIPNYGDDRIRGTVTYDNLNPGQEISDMIVLEAPTDVATEFTFVCAPSFWERIDGGVKRVSRDSFRLKFNKSDIRTSPY